MWAGLQLSAMPFYQTAHIQVSEGPMELGVQIEGERETVQALCKQVPEIARNLLSEVSAFQPLLRLKGCELTVKARWPQVIQRMIQAVQYVDAETLTPMAAVAGAISDEVLTRILEGSGEQVAKVIVNNGGDMAVYSHHMPVRIGIRGVGMPNCEKMVIPEKEVPYGVATSGWRGRSFSQGIADAVVVVAPCGAVADAAATHIGNQIKDEKLRTVRQRRAFELDPETDIPDLQVTVSCGSLKRSEKLQALKNGLKAAKSLFEKGLISKVALYLQGEHVGFGGFW